MKRTTKYVALDVHRASTVAAVREESGRVIARSVLPTEERAIAEFVRGHAGRDSRHVRGRDAGAVVARAGGPAGRSGRRVRSAGGARHGNAGDQVDADQLSELLRRGGLRPVYHGSD